MADNLYIIRISRIDGKEIYAGSINGTAIYQSYVYSYDGSGTIHDIRLARRYTSKGSASRIMKTQFLNSVHWRATEFKVEILQIEDNVSVVGVVLG